MTSTRRRFRWLAGALFVAAATVADASGTLAAGAARGGSQASQRLPALPIANAGPVVIAAGAVAVNTTVVSVAAPAENAVSTRVSNDGASWILMAYSATIPWDLTNPSAGGTAGDGGKTVFVAWQDSDGNWTPTQSDSILLDREAPVGQHVSIGNGSLWFNKWITAVHAVATDATSGIAQIAISNDGVTWSTFPPPPLGLAVTQSFALTPGLGLKTVYVQWADAAGNWSAVMTDTVTIETTAPTVSAGPSSCSPAAPPGEIPCVVNWSGADLESGLVGYLVERSVAGGAWQSVRIPRFASATTATVTVPPGLESRFRLSAFDWAGNSTGPIPAWAMFPPARLRLSGSDRYATAAAVSAATYSPGAEVAYIATGRDFADALAGAAPAGALVYLARTGPVLLVPGSSIPPVVAAELARLMPKTIIVLGGPGAVSEEVVLQLDAYTDGLIYRFGGADRYATAVVISASHYPEGVPVVYIATGRDFPDALAGAAAAGDAGGPVLLVPGTSIPSVVAAELTRLKPEKIIVLGGPAAVSNTVVARLDTYTDGLVYRFGGTDRFATAAIVSASTYSPGVSVVYVATGRDFPDALAGAAAAGAARAPLLLVTSSSIPAATDAELKRLKPSRIIVLGGAAAVSDAVYAQLATYTGG